MAAEDFLQISNTSQILSPPRRLPKCTHALPLTTPVLQLHAAAEPLLTPSRAPIATPINLVLFALLAYLVYTRLRPSPPVTLPKGAPPKVFRTFTPRTLLPYNGENGQPVYLSACGQVYDVTPGRNFYGPGGPYANFAGRDASRGLACGSFDEDMLTKDLDAPLDKLDDLGEEEMTALADWVSRFSEKYLVVGKLVPVGDPAAS